MKGTGKQIVSNEMLAKIKEAEAAARQAVADAEERAAAIISDAREAARLKKETDTRSIEALVRAERESAKKEAEEIVEKSVRQAEANASQIASRADKNMGSAVKRIMGGLNR